MCYKAEREKKYLAKVEIDLRNFPDFLKDYFLVIEMNSTAALYLTTIRGLLTWLIDTHIIKRNSISEITTEDLQQINYIDIVKFLKNKRYANSTAMSKIKIFSSLWEHLVDLGYVPTNIFNNKKLKRLFRKDRYSQDTVEIPTKEQIIKTLNKCKSGMFNFWKLRDLAVIVTFAASGLRKVELMGIDINNIFLDEDRPYCITAPKGTTKEIPIYIENWAVPVLKKYIEVRAKMILKNDEALFLSNKLSRINEQTLKDIFDIGDNSIRPHMMRHLFGSEYYISHNNDIVSTCDRLRHSNINITYQYYMNINIDVMFKDIFEEMFPQFAETNEFQVKKEA